jgi:hypothetical protein
MKKLLVTVALIGALVAPAQSQEVTDPAMRSCLNMLANGTIPHEVLIERTGSQVRVIPLKPWLKRTPTPEEALAICQKQVAESCQNLNSDTVPCQRLRAKLRQYGE